MNQIEAAITDQVSFFRDNLNTYIAALEGERSDGMTVKRVKTANISLSEANPFNHNEYPVCNIYPRDIVEEYLSAGNNALLIDYTAVIVFTAGDESRSTLRATLYAEAARQMLRDYQDLGSGDWDLHPEEAVTVSLYPTDETELKLLTVQWRTVIEIQN